MLAPGTTSQPDSWRRHSAMRRALGVACHDAPGSASFPHSCSQTAPSCDRRNRSLGAAPRPPFKTAFRQAVPPPHPASSCLPCGHGPRYARATAADVPPRVSDKPRTSERMRTERMPATVQHQCTSLSLSPGPSTTTATPSSPCPGTLKRRPTGFIGILKT